MSKFVADDHEFIARRMKELDEERRQAREKAARAAEDEEKKLSPATTEGEKPPEPHQDELDLGYYNYAGFTLPYGSTQ